MSFHDDNSVSNQTLAFWTSLQRKGMDLARNAARDLRVRATRIIEERGNHSITNGNTSTNNNIVGRSLGFGLEMTNQILGKKDLVCMLVVRCIDFLDERGRFPITKHFRN